MKKAAALKESKASPGGGFTLVEVMVASAIALVVVSALMTTLVQFQQHMESQRFIAEVQQNMRVGLTYMTRDISMAGYGLKDVRPQDLSRWINWGPAITDNPTVMEGDTGADQITIAGAFERPGSLAHAASNTSVIVLNGTDTDKFDTGAKSLIFIGRCELARILNIMGNTMTITTDIDDYSQGLKHSYPVGTPVELVQIVTYSIDIMDTGENQPPFLKREDHTGETAYWFQQVVTTGIEDLQMEENNDLVKVVMRGRSLEVDTAYTSEDFGDNYRRMTMTNLVYVRN
ncbi:MAG: prepilin-type N-terminal cleavage/methylation domain-containing protein [Spartobacteria bacterium]|nr:prepilin-type N-terminal cleavage/methylation domain-containing protein [Spartobacteria bacterium]